MKDLEKIHILGICGTFMGGVAVLARSMGCIVSGSDKNVYPPMSTQLEKIGIKMHQGYDDSVLATEFNAVIVGNVMTRGMEVVESLLASKQNYISGPQWLGENLLRQKKVFAVAGTHGKTTTSSMLAWILQDNHHYPGFLIGGVAQNFAISARTTANECFVIEADEYDSAFFDKRSKFVHYHANIAVLNNLEFDHADIFKDLDAIKTQFHHFVRTIPKTGTLIVNDEDNNLKDVLKMGCWTPVVRFGLSDKADIWAKPLTADCATFEIYQQQKKKAKISWHLTGSHNMLNALAAMTAALQQGVSLPQAAQSLQKFKGIKRRMEFIGEVNGVKIYDDFAHHPTAIATTLKGMKNKINQQKLIAVFEPRSNSMRSGAHGLQLPTAFTAADCAVVMNDTTLSWDAAVIENLQELNIATPSDLQELFALLKKEAQADCTVVFMSNGSFANAPRLFLQALQC